MLQLSYDWTPAGAFKLPAGLSPEEIAERRALHRIDPRRYLAPGYSLPPPNFHLVREATALDCLPGDELVSHVDNSLEKIKVWAPIPFEPHKPVVIIGGGPSAADDIDLVREKWERGDLLIAINGAHDWLIYEHGIIPWAASFLDPLREPAIGWVQRPHKDVIYIIGSIIHPDVLAALEGHNVIGWHPVTGPVVEHLAKVLKEDFVAMGGGSTAALRMLNFAAHGGARWVEFFGLDSSYREERHHAYDQPIPPDAPRYNQLHMWCAGRRFIVDSGMAIQVEDFKKLMYQFWPLVTIVIHGDGLLPHVWNEELKISWNNISRRLPNRR